MDRNQREVPALRFADLKPTGWPCELVHRRNARPIVPSLVDPRVAHELRNPLSALSNATRLLKKCVIISVMGCSFHSRHSGSDARGSQPRERTDEFSEEGRG